MIQSIRPRGCARTPHRAWRAPRVAVACLCLAAGAATRADAQQPQELRLGQPATGTLRDADPSMLSGYGPFHVYRVSAQQGERLIFTLRSGAFDALLTLLHPVGGIHEVIASDDDGGGGTDARLRWKAPRAGTYLVVAQSLEPDGRGGYSLVAEAAPSPRPIAVQPIRLGQPVTGTLTEESSVTDDEDEVFHDLYAFDARAGQELVITLDSEDFDAFVAVGPLTGTAIEVIDTDDDGGADSNARLRVTVPEDGRYGIQARGFAPGATGSYVLTVREAPLPPPQPLQSGRDVRATLGEDGIDQWLVEGSAGERVRITMRSDDFDTYLVIFRLDDGRLEQLAENDDADGGTDSVIDITLPAAGQYVVRTSAFGARRGDGHYTIRLDAGR